MLNTSKLLYILPDVAYIADLLPTKKEHTFSIQSFRQINGEFINENEFIAENIDKLFSKLQPDEYYLVLPDFLFTNTVVGVEETSENKVKEYLKSKLLPDLDLNTKSHELKTFVLTEYGGKSRVQLSALEKTLMNPISTYAEQYKIKLSAISPLSWTLKSVVSLEPSITLVQMGEYIYLAEHYIGVDQANYSKVDDIATLGETIKTLKGAESSIQTAYLLTNSLIEEKLKEQLNDILPLQQLATFQEEDTEMPSYVRQVIESSMKTLSISDFPVPAFPLSKPTGPIADPKAAADKKETEADPKAAAVAAAAAVASKNSITEISLDADEPEENSETTTSETEATDTETKEKIDPTTEENSESDTDTTSESTSTEEELPKPSTPPTTTEETTDANVSPVSIAESLEPAPTIATLPTSGGDDNPPNDSSTDSENDSETKESSKDKTDTTSESPSFVINDNANEAETEDSKMKSETDTPETTKDESTTVETEEKDETSSTESSKDKDSNDSTDKEEKDDALPSDLGGQSDDSSSDIPDAGIIKNKSGIQPMLKMVGISILVFLVTVAIGVGLGFGFLSLSEKNTNSQPTTSTASPSPEIAEASPEPSPSPEPEVDLSELSILVVNATTKAGYAGSISDLLDTAGVGTTKTGNAQGEYEEGNYLLMAEENEALLKKLSSSTDLTLTFEDTIKTEDTAGKYDAVVVLAE